MHLSYKLFYFSLFIFISSILHADALAGVTIGAEESSILANGSRYYSMGVVPCEGHEDVLCGFDIQTRAGGEGRYNHEARIIEIPAGTQIIASKIVTAEAGQFGRVYGQYGEPGYDPLVKMWFSKEPGGSAIASNCQSAQKFVWGMRWQTGVPYHNQCLLEPNTVYYFNMQHADTRQGKDISEIVSEYKKSTKKRWVRGNYRKGYPKGTPEAPINIKQPPESADDPALGNLTKSFQFFLKQRANTSMKQRILDNPEMLAYLVKHELRQTELQSFSTDLDAVFKQAGIQETNTTGVTTPEPSTPTPVASGSGKACKTLDGEMYPHGWTGKLYVQKSTTCMDSCENHAITDVRCTDGGFEECRGGTCRPFLIEMQGGPSFGPIASNRYSSAMDSGYASCSLDACRSCSFQDGGSVPHGWTGKGYREAKTCGRCQQGGELECVDGNMKGGAVTTQDTRGRTRVLWSGRNQSCQALSCSWRSQGTRSVSITNLHLGGNTTCAGSKPPSGRCSEYGAVCSIRDFEKNTTQGDRPAATMQSWRCGD